MFPLFVVYHNEYNYDNYNNTQTGDQEHKEHD